MPGIAILCSGQGKQDAAMFERLRLYSEAQALEEKIRAAAALPPESDNPDLWFRNDIAQPCICLYQALAWAVIKSNLPAPDIFAGYSLGELSAYGCAGVFAPEELVRLATVRGRLMTDAAVLPQTMAAVRGLGRDRIEALAAGCDAHLAIINAADHFIVGLPSARIETFLAAATAAGATHAAHLPVTVAAHTPFMTQAADAFNRVLQSAAWQPAAGSLLAGINGEKVFTRAQMIAALTAQVHQAIDWRACLEGAFSYGCRIFLELGPGDSLTRMTREALPGVEARSASEFHDLYAIAKWINAAMLRQ